MPRRNSLRLRVASSPSRVWRRRKSAKPPFRAQVAAESVKRKSRLRSGRLRKRSESMGKQSESTGKRSGRSGKRSGRPGKRSEAPRSCSDGSKSVPNEPECVPRRADRAGMVRDRAAMIRDHAATDANRGLFPTAADFFTPCGSRRMPASADSRRYHGGGDDGAGIAVTRATVL